MSVKIGFKSRVFNFVSSVVSSVVNITKEKSTGRYKYGENDNLPNILLCLVQDSGTATSCVSKIDAFLQADGFVEKTSGKFKVNDEQTADDLLSEISSYHAINEAYALHISFSLDGDKKVKSIPFEWVRKNYDGTFSVNEFFGTPEYKKSEDKILPAYNPANTPEQNKVILQDELKKNGGKQLGSIFYVYRKKAGQLIYPVAEWYSGNSDVKSDSSISDFELENLENGFFPSAILTLIGKIDDKTKDKEGLTESDRLDINLKSFTGKGNKKKRRSLMVLNADTKDQIPDLKSFDIKPILDGLTDCTDRVSRKVARIFGLPPVLIGIEEAGKLGSSQQLVNEISLFNFFINRRQRQISRTFQILFPEKDWTISTLNPISYIPDQVWDKLTDDEIRNLGGFQPLPVDTTQKAGKTIDAINTLSPLVATKVMDTLSSTEVRGLVGLGESTDPPAPTTP